VVVRAEGAACQVRRTAEESCVCVLPYYSAVRQARVRYGLGMRTGGRDYEVR